jgi:hypothetical protein
MHNFPQIRDFFATSDRRVALFIFFALWLTYSFIGPGRSALNPNSVSRMGVVFSILEDQSLRIDKFAPFTIDKALFDGSYYSDKAPGISLTALPFVATLVSGAKMVGVDVRPISDAGLSRFYLFSVFVACAFTSGLSSAAAAGAIFLLVRHWGLGRDAALLSALLYGLATPVAGWATAFFSHAMAGSLLVIAFTVSILATETEKYGRWILAVGFLEGVLLSWSFSVEFTGAPAVLILSIFNARRLFDLPASRSMRLLAGGIAGAAVAAVPLAVYNHSAFGSIWHIGYENVSSFEGMNEGFFGISMPNAAVLSKIVFGQWRGILWISPVLVFAPIAYLFAFRHLRIDVALVLLLIPAAYFLINCGYYYWDGGYSTGPRHVTASLGFISLAFGPLWNFTSLKMRSALLATGLISGVISLACASVSMVTPSFIARPVIDWIIPQFLMGQVHNALTSVGIHDLRSLIGIPLMWALAAFVTAPVPRLMLGYRRGFPGLHQSSTRRPPG